MRSESQTRGAPRMTGESTLDLTEEERERRKAEKRRAKKKRRKEKKNLEKLETPILSQNSDNCNNRRDDDSPSEDEDEEGQGLDLNSAFVANAAAKKGVLPGGPAKERPPCPTPQLHHPPPTTSTFTTTREKRQGHGDIPGESLVQACQLAKQGNKAADVGQYMLAVEFFNAAICLDSSDYRSLTDRSYCFSQLGHHTKALEDAERAIAVAPQWAKGHYRRGTSLRDLGRFVDAEAAFEEVLRLDTTCGEAREEIRRLRVARIVNKGFTDRQAASAIAKHINVQPALSALCSETMEDVFYSDDDEDELMKQAKVSQGAQDVKMNPQNPEGHTSLWVGNVVPEVTEKALTQLFSKQCQVKSVRLLPERRCAFVNYADKVAAGRAMELLQSHELCGRKLLIKFPDNPINPGVHNHVLHKGKASAYKNPQNPEGHTSLWVGNVVPEVTEKALTQLFSKQCQVRSVRLLPERRCAFVNYADEVAAGRAMELLQSHEFCGRKLLIKFPDNPINPGVHNHVLHKGKESAHKKWM